MIDTNRPLRVFLCHASDDKPAVIELYNRLVNDGIDAWLDEKKLIPGQNWKNEIPKAVKNSDVVIVCLSSESINKEGFVQREIKIALDTADEKPEGTIFIIPARLENCKMPDRISEYQKVDLFSENSYELLLKALEVRANTVGAIFELPQEEYLYNDNDLWDKEVENKARDEDIFPEKYSTDLQIAKNRKEVISKHINELIDKRNKEEGKYFGKILTNTAVQAFLSLLFIGVPVFIIAMVAFDVSNLAVYLCSAGSVFVIIFFIFARIFLKKAGENNESTDHIDVEIQKLRKELEPLNDYIYSFNKTERAFYKYKQNKEDLRRLTNRSE